MLKKILMILLFILLFFFLVKDKQSNDYLYKYNGISIDLEKIGNKYILKDNKRNIELIDAKYKKTNEIELKPIEFTKDNESEYLLIFKSLQNIYDYYLNNYNFKKDNIKVIINLDKNNSYAIGSNIIAIGKKDYYLSDSVLMHEYTHLVINSINNLKGKNSKLFTEAYCDIMASIYTNKWYIGDEDNIIRNIKDPYSSKNPIKFNDLYYSNNNHNNSTIISHIAYKMHEKGIGELGIIWLDSLNYLNGELNLDNLENALIESCKNNNLNQYISIIEEIFNE